MQNGMRRLEARKRSIGERSGDGNVAVLVALPSARVSEVGAVTDR